LNKKNSYIHWDDKFVVGVPLIDQQHLRLMNIINDLYQLCDNESGSVNPYLIECSWETLAYLRHHFSTEEKLMLLLGFPGYRDHKTEHDAFIENLLNQYRQFSLGEKGVSEKFVHMLKEWLLTHIINFDKEMANFFLGSQYYEKMHQLFSRRMEWSYQFT